MLAAYSGMAGVGVHPDDLSGGRADAELVQALLERLEPRAAGQLHAHQSCMITKTGAPRVRDHARLQADPPYQPTKVA